MIRHEGMQKLIERYVAELLKTCGQKSPQRRMAYETDVGYALEVMAPYARRFDEAMRYNIYAVEEDFAKALCRLNDAVDVLGRFGVDVALPAVIENPRTIEAECAMALIDTLRSLDAFRAEEGERFVEAVIAERFAGRVRQDENGGADPVIKTFIRRYARDEIPEEVLDAIACEEGGFEEYLESLQGKTRLRRV